MYSKMALYFLVPFLLTFLTELHYLGYSLSLIWDNLIIIFLKSLAPGLVAVKALMDTPVKPNLEITSETELTQVKSTDGTITTTERYKEIK